MASEKHIISVNPKNWLAVFRNVHDQSICFRILRPRERARTMIIIQWTLELLINFNSRIKTCWMRQLSESDLIGHDLTYVMC